MPLLHCVRPKMKPKHREEFGPRPKEQRPHAKEQPEFPSSFKRQQKENNFWKSTQRRYLLKFSAASAKAGSIWTKLQGKFMKANPTARAKSLTPSSATPAHLFLKMKKLTPKRNFENLRVV